MGDADEGGGLSGGLVAWGVLCFLFTVCFAAWLVRHFARPRTPPAIFFITFLAWLCAFSIVFLVPLDVAKNASTSLEGVWNVLFWVGFICTWVLLPMVQEYYDNGGFTWKQKLLLACKQNGILVAVALTVVTILCVYLTVSRGLGASELGGVFKVLSNTFGLVLLTFLAGYGLVEVPRTLYYASHRLRRRDFVYYTASATHHEAEDTRDEFSVLLKLIDLVDRKVQSKHDATLTEYMAEIKETARDKEQELQRMQYRAHPCKLKIFDQMKDLDTVGTRDLIALNHAVRKCVRHLWLVDQLWSDTVDEGFAIEAELDDTNVTGMDGVAPPEEQPDGRLAELYSRLPSLSAENNIRWRRHFRPKVLLASSILLGVLSVLLLWSELTIAFQSRNVDLSPFTYIVSGLENVAVLQQLFTVGLLLYLFVCTAYPVFKVRVSSLYYCGPHHTDTNSLVYNATVLLRVSIALAYNFSILLSLPAGALELLIGSIQEIPFFGGSFNQFFPIFMAVWAFLILVHAIGRLLKCMSVERFQFVTASANATGEMSDSAMEVKSQITEGQGLIKQEKRRRDRARESGETYTPHISGPGSPRPVQPDVAGESVRSARRSERLPRPHPGQEGDPQQRARQRQHRQHQRQRGHHWADQQQQQQRAAQRRHLEQRGVQLPQQVHQQVQGLRQEDGRRAQELPRRVSDVWGATALYRVRVLCYAVPLLLLPSASVKGGTAVDAVL